MKSRQFYAVLGVVAVLAVASAGAAVAIAFAIAPSDARQGSVPLMFRHFFTFAGGAIVTLLSGRLRIRRRRTSRRRGPKRA